MDGWIFSLNSTMNHAVGHYVFLFLCEFLQTSHYDYVWDWLAELYLIQWSKSITLSRVPVSHTQAPVT